MSEIFSKSLGSLREIKTQFGKLRKISAKKLSLSASSELISPESSASASKFISGIASTYFDKIELTLSLHAVHMNLVCLVMLPDESK